MCRAGDVTLTAAEVEEASRIIISVISDSCRLRKADQRVPLAKDGAATLVETEAKGFHFQLRCGTSVRWKSLLVSPHYAVVLRAEGPRVCTVLPYVLPLRGGFLGNPPRAFVRWLVLVACLCPRGQEVHRNLCTRTTHQPVTTTRAAV